MLKGAAGVALSLTLAPVRSQGQDDPTAVRPKPGDLLVKVGDGTLKPLEPSDISVGAAPTMAWAMAPDDKTVRNGSRLNRVLLVKIDREQLGSETRAIAADGVVAYTAICTHSGCEVTEWLPDEKVLYCSCHSSKFDPRDGARVVDGPAPRNLPALPLSITDGRLVVARGFTARVGFDAA